MNATAGGVMAPNGRGRRATASAKRRTYTTNVQWRAITQPNGCAVDVKREAHDASKVPGSLSDALTLVLRAELELARHDRDGAHTATSRRGDRGRSSLHIAQTAPGPRRDGRRDA
jgi:hypothetical protein